MINLNNSGLVDKRSYLFVIGCLLLDPNLLDDIDRPLDRTDFNTEKFYELLFVAIYNLHMQGCVAIDEFSIDSYLSFCLGGKTSIEIVGLSELITSITFI